MRGKHPCVATDNGELAVGLHEAAQQVNMIVHNRLAFRSNSTVLRAIWWRRRRSATGRARLSRSWGIKGGELKECGTFFRPGQRAEKLLRFVAAKFAQGLELAEHFTVAGAVEGLFGLYEGVEGQDAEAQAFDFE